MSQHRVYRSVRMTRVSVGRGILHNLGEYHSVLSTQIWTELCKYLRYMQRPLITHFNASLPSSRDVALALLSTREKKIFPPVFEIDLAQHSREFG